MNKLLNQDIDFEMSLFQVLASTAIIANTLGYISDVIFYGINNETIFTFVCALIMYIVSGLGMYLRKPKIPIIGILFMCTLIEFPVMYAIYGGDRIGYMILGIVGVALFFKGRMRTYGTGFLIVFDTLIVLWRKLNPNMVFMSIQGDSTVAAAIDFVIVGVSISVMLIMLLNRYEKQQIKLQKLTTDLQLMVNLDPLTQLYNRRYLTEYLDEKIKEQDVEFAVALLDIDDFKKINDHYGHLYGDKTLQEFASIMKRAVKGYGIAARYGGEEFMLVFEQTEKKIMEEILEHIAHDFECYGRDTKECRLSFSAGVEIFHNEDRITKLFNAADEKLYHAKHMGKNKVVYSEEK